MAEKIRWGILSTGNIAGAFARGLAYVEDAELVAVGSRTQAAADQFGEKYSIPHRYGSYEALAADPAVDVIYIATPHPLHHANALLCLEQGKAVLVEKAFTMNAADAADIVRVARAKRLFAMEAMWTRFIPLFVEFRRMLAEDTLGEIRLVQADFGYHARFDPASRLFAPELGGGALLDLGIYPVSLASLIYGVQPQQIASFAHRGETGVDEWTGIHFNYAGDGLANLFCGLRVNTPCEAVIAGDRGMVRILPQWHRADALELTLNGQPPRRITAPIEGSGYRYEAAEVVRCMQAGKLESEIMPLDETVALMQTLDRIQQQWTGTGASPGG